MAEYLSPGVYVEEFDSGAKPMEGAPTSTSGFVGAAEKGPVEGFPQSVTSFADFQRIYGGYLSAKEYGNNRFLAYAVEHFFVNGGSRCFVARVKSPGSVCALGAVLSAERPVLSLKAGNPGCWGNDLKAVISPFSKAETQIYEVLEEAEGTRYLVKNSTGFMEGDIVAFSDGTQRIYNQIVKVRDNIIRFANEFSGDVTDHNLLPEKTISTCAFSMEVSYGGVVEIYDSLSLNTEVPDFIEKKMAKSALVSVSFEGGTLEELKPLFERMFTEEGVVSVNFSKGSDGDTLGMTAADFIGVDNGGDKRTGIQAFLDNDAVSIMAVPGVTDPKVQLALIGHCENLASRFAVLDLPQNAKKVQDMLNHRNMFDTTYGAFYHPWLTVFEPLDKKNIQIPPSGSVIGIYARNDNTRGVHKAPANEVVRGCVGLDVQFDKGEQDILNPNGVNLIRSIPGQGIRVWGARTAGSDRNWKYVNVRRLFIFIEESMKASIGWAAFESNDEVLWVRVQRTIEAFLTNLWRNGSMAGMSPEEAFFVSIDRSTMTQEDIDNGRLICVIGVAPVKPAEFVIIRLTQKTADAR